MEATLTETAPVQTEHLTIEMEVTADQKSAILNFFQAMNFPVQVQENDEEDDEPVMTREEIIDDLREAVAEMKLVRAGKLEPIRLKTKQEIKQFFDELRD
jgi:hypothetical protein